MIFYRSPASTGAARGPSLGALRVLTSVALAAYPAGALTLALGGEGGGGLFPHEIAGLGLILIAFLASAPVIGSRLQRIVGDQASQLDEFETQLRHKALSWGYSAFTALVLAAIFYGGVASDAGLWLPIGFDNWSGLFWGAFLYAVLLPTAFLAWTMQEPAEED